MEKRLRWLWLALLFSPIAVWGQTDNRALGDEAYGLLDYAGAIFYYNQVVKDTADPAIMARIGSCYHKMEDYLSAEFWLGKAVKSGAKPVVRIDYGNALKATGKYPLAKSEFREYGKISGDTALAGYYQRSCDYAMICRWDSLHYATRRLPLNTAGSDVGAYLHYSSFYYASTTDLNGYDIFQRNFPIARDEESLPLEGSVNSAYHDGPFCLSSDGRTMYFTRSNFNDLWLDWGEGDIHKLELFSAHLDKNKWTKVALLPFNGEGYSTGHPTLSADGRWLVFTSDRPGSIGGSDLWRVEKFGESWSEPVNLGPTVNTERNEMFPFFHESGALLFASDGHVGLGELDLFVSRPEGNGFGVPRNLGYPLNSNKDDFSIAWKKYSALGYFSSNRTGSGGSDDLYEFERQIPVDLTVTSDITGKPMNKVKVSVFDENRREQKFVTDEKGRCRYFQRWKSNFTIECNQIGYRTSLDSVATQEIDALSFLEKGILMKSDRKFNAKLTVTDAETGAFIDLAQAQVIGEAEETTETTDEKGFAFLLLESHSDFTILVLKEGYVPEIISITTRGLVDEKTFILEAKLKKGNYLLLSGQTVHFKTEQAVPGVQINPTDGHDKPVSGKTISRTDGKFWTVVKPGVGYSAICKKVGYFVARGFFPKIDFTPKDTLIPIGQIPMVDYRVGEIARTIYYDFDDSKITSESAYKLRSLSTFLLDNPETVVSLNSHTDAWGDDGYNLELSKRRAIATVSYLKDLKIDGLRMRPAGFGETFPVNECSNLVNCSDEKHAQNRRTELQVIGFLAGKGKADSLPESKPGPNGIGEMVEGFDLPFQEKTTMYSVWIGVHNNAIPELVYRTLGDLKKQLYILKNEQKYTLFVGKVPQLEMAQQLKKKLLESGFPEATVITSLGLK